MSLQLRLEVHSPTAHAGFFVQRGTCFFLLQVFSGVFCSPASLVKCFFQALVLSFAEVGAGARVLFSCSCSPDLVPMGEEGLLISGGNKYK